MFQTIFTNKKRGFSQEVTPTPEFMRQYNATCAEYPLMTYPIDMGIKQAIPDSMAGVKDEATFCAKILKKADAVFAGTVRVATGVERQPTRTPMEREIWRLASIDMAKVFEKNAKKGNPVAKDRQAHYIRLWIERHWEELNEKATENLANSSTIATNAADDFDELLAALDDEEEEAEEAEEAA